MEQIGKMLIGLGAVLLVLGVLLVLAGKLPWLGKLPGDIVIQNENLTCMFPLATSILVSLVLTVLLNLLLRIFSKP